MDKITDRINEQPDLGQPVIDYKQVAVKLGHGTEITVNLSMELLIDECFDYSDLEEIDRDRIKRDDLQPYLIAIVANFQQLSESVTIGGCLIDKPMSVKELIETFELEDLELEAIGELKTALELMYLALR